MVDLIVRGVRPQTIQFLNSVRGSLSREAYLRNLIESTVEDEKYRQGFLAPDLKDLQKNSAQSPQATLDILQEMYEQGLISYPRTCSRYLRVSDWRNAAGIIGQIQEILQNQTIHTHKHHLLKLDTFSLVHFTRLSKVLNLMNERGYPAPSALYNDEMRKDHPGITPTLHKSDKLYQLSEDAFALYAVIVSCFINALWNNLDDIVKSNTFLQDEDAKQGWTPFREKATGKIVAARWRINKELNGNLPAGGGWEVAGEPDWMTTAEQAAKEWESL